MGNNPLSFTDPSGLAGHTVTLGGGEAKAYVEWFPDKGVAEMKVMSNANEELVRFRWSKDNPQVIQTIVDHGGKPLPGVSQSQMQGISRNITDQLKIMINRAGGEYSRTMIPPDVRAAYSPQKSQSGTKGVGATARNTLIGLVIAQIIKDIENAKANAAQPGLKVPAIMPLIHPDDIERVAGGAKIKPNPRITGFQVRCEDGTSIMVRPGDSLDDKKLPPEVKKALEEALKGLK